MSSWLYLHRKLVNRPMIEATVVDCSFKKFSKFPETLPNSTVELYMQVCAPLMLSNAKSTCTHACAPPRKHKSVQITTQGVRSPDRAFIHLIICIKLSCIAKSTFDWAGIYDRRLERRDSLHGLHARRHPLQDTPHQPPGIVV